MTAVMDIGGMESARDDKLMITNIFGFVFDQNIQILTHNAPVCN